MKRVFCLVVILLLLGPISHGFAQREHYEISEEEFQASTDQPLEVILKIDAGEVVVKKGMDSTVGRVEIRYTPRKFRQKIDFNEKTNRLKVHFDMKGWRSVDTDDDRAEVTVELPYGVDILFDAHVKAGEVTMDMGGLRLKEYVYTNWAGEVEVRFDEPNPITMDLLDINAKVGEATFVRLGNARFKKADINGGIGEMRVDFRGNVIDECKAKVDLDIGEATIILPRDVGVKMRIGGGFSFLSEKNIDHSFYKEGSTYYSENYEDEEGTFYVRVSPGLGELNIERE